MYPSTRGLYDDTEQCLTQFLSGILQHSYKEVLLILASTQRQESCFARHFGRYKDISGLKKRFWTSE